MTTENAIKVTLKQTGSKTRTYWFQTLYGAQKYAQKYVGTKPGFSDEGAVSNDGQKTILCTGCKLIELFPAIQKDEPKPNLKKETKTMAKDDKKKTQPPKKQEPKKEPEKEAPASYEMDSRRAFTVLAERIWKEDDRPDISEMTDDECLMDLKDNIEFLTPEDKDLILSNNPEDGQAVWDYFVSLRADLAAQKTAETKKGKADKPPKEKKTKEPKAQAEPRYTRSDAFAEAIRKSPKTAEALINDANDIYVRNGGKDNLKESKWMAGYAFKLLSSLNLLQVSGDKIESIAECITNS